MKVALFSTKPYDRGFFSAANKEAGHELVFFEDLSNRVIQDDVFSRMLTFPNVIVTGHQAFFTRNAMEAIARETLANVTAFERGEEPPGLLRPERVMA